VVESEINPPVTDNLAGGAVMVSETGMFCALPAQGLGATQVTAIDV
jgi:hypothetical protein